jgi:hypothetical protein
MTENTLVGHFLTQPAQTHLDCGAEGIPMSQHHAVINIQALDFWLARGAIVVVAALQVAALRYADHLPEGLRWFAPTLEIVLVILLSIATAWNQNRARQATSEHHWSIIARHRRAIRGFALLVTALVSIVNVDALVDLVRDLLTDMGVREGNLLLQALNLWVTNVVIFALWFWELDRGGPAMRGLHSTTASDFLFPQMTTEARERDKRFSPGFVDYLFLAFTNATAFSPTDTLPLSQRAKLLMMIEASISLLIVALVAARAINMLPGA